MKGFTMKDTNMHERSQKGHRKSNLKQTCNKPEVKNSKPEVKKSNVTWIRYKLDNKMTWIRASNTLKELFKNLPLNES